MSVEKLIDELGERGLLPDRVAGKLREKLAQTPRPLSAKAVAKFLVDKQHITHRQATEVLGTLRRRGVDIDDASAMSPATREKSGFVVDEADDDVDAESSSIFAPYLTGEPNTKSVAASPEDELGLAPGSDAAINGPVGELEAEAAAAELPLVDKKREQPEKRGREKEAARGKERVEERVSKLKAREAPAAEVASPKRRSRSTLPSEPTGSRQRKSAGRESEWESPLMLIGGGALVVLVLGGVTIAWLLNWESGDAKLRAAQEAVASGSYTQAIAHYQEFLENFPRHRDHSVARVELASARLRKAVDATNYDAALDIAEEELPAIEDEEKFSEVHGELASLLPRIAMGLATEAETSADLDAAQQLVDRSSAALALASNTKYVPKSLRDEGELDIVRGTLERVRQRQQSRTDLQKAIAAMEQAIAAGDTRASYSEHVALVKQHPELANEASLAEMVRKTSAAEQAAIRYVDDEQAAESTDRPTPWVASLAVAHRQENVAAGGPDGAACVKVDGAVYGIEGTTGRLLWRRQVGHSTSPPMRIGDDVLIVDTERHELLRVNAMSGDLRWRQLIGERFARPVVVGDRGFVAAESGRLFVVDLQTGVRMGFVQFAQPLRVGPAINTHHGKLYLAGAHSSMYSISLSDLSCTGVYYLGHADGSIPVSPAVVLDKLVVLENDGVETSTLHLLSLDAQGTIAAELIDRRLSGSATSTPLVAGARLLVLTDRGQIEVFDVGSGEGADSLTPIASRPATGKEPLARHAALVGRSIWVGDTQLTKYSVLPTGNRLPVESIENDFQGATFDHPFEVLGNTLIHVHRPKGKAGATVAAIDNSQGRVLWQTQLAVPPAGEPVVDQAKNSFTVANSAGLLFRFDEAAIRSRVQDQAISPSPPANLSPLAKSIDLGNGRAAFFSTGSDRLLLYNPAQGQQSARWIQLESPLACPITRLGEAIVVPLKVGQVFCLNASDGSSLGTPFQPRLRPRTTLDYQPAGVLDEAGRRFVISDGREKIYVVGMAEQPSRHWEAIAEANAGPYPIQSQIFVLGENALAVAGQSHLVRFRLPSLESAGDTPLSAAVVWGPFRAGDALLLATADAQLQLFSATGDEIWRSAIEHGDLAGAPLVVDGDVVLAYRNGMIERRALGDGKPIASVDVEHSLATGPVAFLQRIVAAASDGTLLVIDQP